MSKRQITIKPTCMREVAAFPAEHAGQLWEKINLLVTDPLPDGKVKKKLRTAQNMYRLRVGDYRVFYQFGTDWVSVLGIRRRSEDIDRAVFPRYAFPTDVVSFWVARARRPGESANKRFYDYEPQRDLQLALSEYVPGRSLTIDKWRFESAALFSPYEPNPTPVLERRQPYTACRSCSYVSLAPESAMATMCPCCGSAELEHTSFVTPSGFAPDINEKREVDRGEPIVYAGITERAQLEVQEISGEWHRELYGGRLKVWTGPQMLAMVNKGVCPASTTFPGRRQLFFPIDDNYALSIAVPGFYIGADGAEDKALQGCNPSADSGARPGRWR
jgi:mRNA-degrading endonuclease RelE of RelBE toxin-antitoxin system